MNADPAALFEATVRRRDAAFHAGDLETILRSYREDAVEIDPGGGLHLGREAIGAQLAFVFGLGLTARFTELERIVDPGHGTAVLVLDSTFTSASADFRQHFLTAQTFTFADGDWQLRLAANTMLPG